MASSDWSAALREARMALGLSRKALAERAHVSPATIKAYERGVRRPSRPYLSAIIAALAVDRGWRNEIFAAAGFAPDGFEQRPGNIERWMFTEEEAEEEIAAYPWPAFVQSERAQVLTANQVAQQLWGVDLRYEFTDPVDRNLLSVASSARFADRCVNWDEAVKTIMLVFRTFHRGPESLEAPSPYFAAVLQRFLEGDPRYVTRFVELWDQVPSTSEWDGRMRWSYPVVWDEPGIGVMRFQALVSVINEMHGWAVNDWIPQDAESWQRLEELKRRADA